MSSADGEIIEILRAVRECLNAGRELGLEPPALSPAALAYLEGRGTPKPPQNPTVTLEGVRDLLGECRRCKLSSGRRNLVFGEGSLSARLVFVGEAPGREEDLQGRPFVGEAGTLLNKIIESGMGLKREDVYICNIVKCRPPDNRKPEPDEIESCMPFLREQLRILNPEVICALGQVAASSLLGKKCRISDERGKWSSFMGAPLMPTFHPAFILRNPQDEKRLKKLVWADVQMIMAKMGLQKP
ncbi:MAG: uracil-DNA glycosylase [Desulfobacteraceae bacterium]|nr:MAG: uracil-DNA glycosylase [Desulfobacteraceae bacterium]